MRILISDKRKKEIFISLISLLKNSSSVISASFDAEQIHIQGMDKSHVCLFDIKINKNWFNEYNVNEIAKVCFDPNVFHSIISTKSDNQDLIIKMDYDNLDVLHINFKSKEIKKGEFKKTFKMSLIEYDYEEFNIPIVDYDTDFSLSSKQITDLFTQLSNFGSNITFNCSEENISLTTTSDTGEMIVDIPVDDLTSFCIIEDETLMLTYSLLYLNKMCITNKLSNDIELSLSNNSPMKINYNLGDDSSVTFFIAPKTVD